MNEDYKRLYGDAISQIVGKNAEIAKLQDKIVELKADNKRLRMYESMKDTYDNYSEVVDCLCKIESYADEAQYFLAKMRK